MPRENETPEERAARKAAKRAKKEQKEASEGKKEDKSVELESVEKKKSKKSKKEKAVKVDEPTEEVSKKKRKREDDKKGDKKSKKSSKKATPASESPDSEEEETVTPPPRMRTRSISDAEEEVQREANADKFRKEHQITITGKNDSGSGPFVPPVPMMEFSDTPFQGAIRKALDDAGFPSPTPTQAQVWPIALTGRDVIAVAKTGSGKTCGFLLPCFHRMLGTPRQRGSPGILVLAPTRELACQIEEESKRFGRSSSFRSTCAYGGQSKGVQIQKIQNGVEVLIATPGRLNDFIEMRMVDLSQVKYLVLDEADRMLDMGFEPQIRTIIEKLPSERQSMMFTATWPKEIQSLAQTYTRSPVEMRFGDVNSLNANKAIKQVITVMDSAQKIGECEKVLAHINPGGDPLKIPKTIVFMARKHDCDYLANKLWNAGYSVDTLHGNREQYERTRVMDKFKRSAINLLVATDVAARGLDVKDIEVVINYDFPAGVGGVEDYVHRIGRTGRAGAEGRSFTFFTADDSRRAKDLVGVLTRAEQEVPEELRKFLPKPQGPGKKGGNKGQRKKWYGGKR